MGVEPTRQRMASPTGFEARPTHQDRSPSVDSPDGPADPADRDSPADPANPADRDSPAGPRGPRHMPTFASYVHHR